MLTWKRRSLAVLPAVLLFWGCAAEETETVTTSGHQLVVTETSRLESLRRAAAPVSTKDAWGADYLQALVVERAWVAGPDLLVETFNPNTRQIEIHSIDAKSGVPNWMLVLGPYRLKVDPMPGDRYLALLTEVDGGMTVVDRRSGARVHHVRVKLGVATTEPAASSETTVYVSSLGGNRVAALNPADGRMGWGYPAPSSITTGPIMTPRLPRRLAVAACLDGTVMAIPAAGFDEPAPEAPAWTYRVLGPVNGELAVGEQLTEGKLSVSILVPCEDRGLYCLDGATGRPNWVFRTESAFGGRPGVMNGVVFARNADRLVAVNLADGTAAWPSSDPGARATQTWEGAVEALALDGERGFLRGGDGMIWRVDGKTGRALASARLGAFDILLSGGPNNVMIGLTRDGYIVAFK
jgi:outer membrane protein assembly factor BamB